MPATMLLPPVSKGPRGGFVAAGLALSFPALVVIFSLGSTQLAIAQLRLNPNRQPPVPQFVPPPPPPPSAYPWLDKVKNDPCSMIAVSVFLLYLGSCCVRGDDTARRAGMILTGIIVIIFIPAGLLSDAIPGNFFFLACIELGCSTLGILWLVSKPVIGIVDFLFLAPVRAAREQQRKAEEQRLADERQRISERNAADRQRLEIEKLRAEALNKPPPAPPPPTREELAARHRRDWEEDHRIAELHPDEPTRTAAKLRADARLRQRLAKLSGDFDEADGTEDPQDAT